MTLRFLTSLLVRKKILFLNYDHKIKCGSEDNWNGFHSTKELFTKYLSEFEVHFATYQEVSCYKGEVFVSDIPLERFSFVFFGFISKNTDLFNVVKESLDKAHRPYLMYGNTRDNDNKLNDLKIFERSNTPHIPTIVTSKWVSSIENLKLPIVVKPYNGSCGNGVVKFDNYKDVEKHITNMQDLKLVQPWIKNEGDYRVITFNNKVVIHSKRIAKEGEWRNNVAQGGSVVKSDLPNWVLKKAEDLSRLIQSNIIGFDIIKDSESGNLLFMEINAGPHYFSFMEENGVDFAKIICDYIRKKTDFRIFIYR
ncbi:ATP-grasp domain-containing protein [bacterium]|nr:ATP-grasp domain-containing protein [bacterium]